MPTPVHGQIRQRTQKEIEQDRFDQCVATAQTLNQFGNKTALVGAGALVAGGGVSIAGIGTSIFNPPVGGVLVSAGVGSIATGTLMVSGGAVVAATGDIINSLCGQNPRYR